MENVREQFEIGARRERGRPPGLWRSMAGVLVGLSLLLASRPASAFDIKALPATTPLIIDQPGHYNVTRDLVSSGSAILIAANGVVLDLHGHTISGPGSAEFGFTGIAVQNASGVTIENGVLTGFYFAIYLQSASGSTVTGNLLTGNGIGIVLVSSNNNALAGNAATGNAEGFEIDFSSNNTLSGNTASGNRYDGIFLFGSNNNVLTGNSASDNGFLGILLKGSNSGNTLTGNTATGNGTSGNGYFDLYDGSPNCGSNTWTNNTFGTANQPCID
jgi:parallel beta-helix repeat protein